MAKKEPAEGKELLDELLSIRQLLDDELQGKDAPSDNIPILHDVDNIRPPLPEEKDTDHIGDNNPVVKRANEALKRNIKRPDALLKPLTRDMLGDNPFLPQQALDKLSANKSQKAGLLTPIKTDSQTDSLLVELLDQSPEQQAKVRQSLEQEGEIIIEQLVNEQLPKLEEALRLRLNKQLMKLLSELNKH